MKLQLALLLLAVPLLALPADFETSVWARPFDIEYPTAITAAADGTVYVSVDKNGSLGKDKGMGKVVACRDTDGDGKADSFTDFVPDVDSPRGGHFVRDTLYLVHPPFLSSFRDTDGDGVSDEHKVLLKNLGFGLRSPRGSDHTTNGCRMGIDGWLYIAVGDFGMEGTTGTDGRVVTNHGGCVARVRPDGTELEVYAKGVRNICDVAISPALDMFTRDNTNDGKGWDTRLHHFTNGGDHGYPRLYKNFSHECLAPMLDLGGGSGTGALYLDEPGLPEMLLTCDWTTGHIYHDSLTKNGASFTAKESIWMKLPRAVDIDVDGESNLYACDWRNGKYTYAGDGKKVGMIQKITRKGLEVEKFPDLTKFDNEKLVSQLFHASSVRRLEAQREILIRGEKITGFLLAGLPRFGSYEGKVAWVFTVKQLLGRESTTRLLKVLDSPDFKEIVLRALSDREQEQEARLSIEFAKALEGPNPRVQLQGVIGLCRRGAPASGFSDKLFKCALDTTDARLKHTCIQALVSIGESEFLLKHIDHPIAQQALQSLHTPEVAQGLIKHLATTANKLPIMTTLSRLYHREGEWDKKSWWGTRPDDRGPYFLLATWSETAVIQKALEEAYATLSDEDKGKALEIFGRNRVAISKLKLGEQDPVLLALRSPLLDDGQLRILTAAAKDSKRPWGKRVESFRALYRVLEGKAIQPQIEILGTWLEQEAPAEDVQRELADFVTQPGLNDYRSRIRTIAKIAGVQTSRVAWQVILSLSRSPLVSPSDRRALLKMAQDNPREEGFFLALADLRMPGFDKQIENAIDSDNDTLIETAKRAREVIAAAKKSGGKKVSEFSIEEVSKLALTRKGDPERGKALYLQQGCIACHALDQKAIQKGPYLGGAGGKFTRDYLIQSILEPNAVVAQGFQTEMITMKNGTVHMGFVTKEQDGLLEIRNIAGIATQIKEADIKERQHQPNSMMPPGLANGLTIEQFTDLTEYLSSLR